MIMTYDIQFIHTIKEEIIKNECLSPNIEMIIQDLTTKVLSPDYCKTPIFNKKRKQNNFIDYNKFSNKTTKIIDTKTVINDIQLLFNKISNVNEKKISKEIIEKLQLITDIPERKEVISLFFNVITKNSMFLKTYSNLIKIIYNSVNYSKNIINQNILDIIENFKQININKNDGDYDSFCIQNEKLTSFTGKLLLITYLYSEKIIDKTIIMDLLNYFFIDINNKKTNENYKEITEYTVHNLCLILNVINSQTNDPEFSSFNTNLTELLKLQNNKNENKGLSNKFYFKIMDYLEENGLEC